MASQGKNSFEFRMSKKVAELTQVVHMLFMRNHEKEVELELLKDAYEHEIDLVQKDARAKIRTLADTLEKLRQSKSQEDSVKHVGDRKKEEEWKKKISDLEGHLSDEKKECQSVQDLLIKAQKDIEALHQVHADTLAQSKSKIESKVLEMSKLKSHISGLEKRLKESDSQSSGMILDLQKAQNRIQRELNQVKDTNQDLEKLKEQLVLRTKQLEAENRQLKKEGLRRDRKNSVVSAMEVREIRDTNVVVGSSIAVFFF